MKIHGIVSHVVEKRHFGTTLDASDEVYRKIFEVSVESWKLIKLVRPRLIEDSSIVLVSSVGGFTPSQLLGLA